MSQLHDEAYSFLNTNHSLGGAAEFDAVVNNLMGKLQTITIVKVLAVHKQGLNPVGYVDLQPLVHQLDAEKNIIPMPRLLNVPYFRLQGGVNAVICDPKVGDLGLCAFASRDISVVKRNKSASPPGSLRQYDLSDGLYIGGFLNGTPNQYVYFTDQGIDIVSPHSINLHAPTVNIKAQHVSTESQSVTTQTNTFAVNASQSASYSGGGGISTDGSIKTTQDVVAGGISLKQHTHKGVLAGGDNTGEPNP